MNWLRNYQWWRLEVRLWTVSLGLAAGWFLTLLATAAYAAFVGYVLDDRSPEAAAVAVWLFELALAFGYAMLGAVLVNFVVMLPLQAITGQRSATVYDRDGPLW